MRERRVNGAYDVVCRAKLQAQQFPPPLDLAYYAELTQAMLIVRGEHAIYGLGER